MSKQYSEEEVNKKTEITFALPMVERVIKYALWIQKTRYEFSDLHRERTEDEICAEVLQTAIQSENAESYKALPIKDHSAPIKNKFYDDNRDKKAAEIKDYFNNLNHSELKEKFYKHYFESRMSSRPIVDIFWEWIEEGILKKQINTTMPTDEEIEEYFYVNEDRMSNGDKERLLRQEGAKWMRDRILNSQQDEK